MGDDEGGVQGHRRVLITGGAGFIGSHLTDVHLARGDEVVIVDNFSTGRASNLTHAGGAARVIDSTVREAAPVLAGEGHRFDLVYHLAAAVGVDLVLGDPVLTIRSNIEETDAVLSLVADTGGAPTLIASSSEVYGKPGTSVFSEDDDVLYGPTSVKRWSYAYTKAIDEFLSLACAEAQGFPVVVSRFFNTVGPRQVGRYGMVLPRFVTSAIDGEPVRVFGDGAQTRCFCDGRDVARLLPELLTSREAWGRVFNVGSDEPISMMDLAREVIDVLGSSSEIETVPYESAYGPGFEDLRHRRPDLTRLRSIVDFRREHTLRDTIRDLAAQIRDERALDGQVS